MEIDVSQVRDVSERIRENIATVVVGKEHVVELMLVALLCEGHLLLEDVPGLGKTTLAKSLARSLGCSYRGIRFTPALLPSAYAEEVGRQTPAASAAIRKLTNI